MIRLQPKFYDKITARISGSLPGNKIEGQHVPIACLVSFMGMVLRENVYSVSIVWCPLNVFNQKKKKKKKKKKDYLFSRCLTQISLGSVQSHY